MKWSTGIILAFVAVRAFAQAPKDNAPPKLERLCGKLQHVEVLPVKNHPRTVVSRDENLPRVKVSLYANNERGQCCEGLDALATTVTGHWGSFELNPKQLPGGLYWLQVEPNRRIYRMLIQYAPKRYSDELCTKRVWAVNDAGDFWKSELMTID